MLVGNEVDVLKMKYTSSLYSGGLVRLLEHGERVDTRASRSFAPTV